MTNGKFHDKDPDDLKMVKNLKLIKQFKNIYCTKSTNK